MTAFSGLQLQEMNFLSPVPPPSPPSGSRSSEMGFQVLSHPPLEQKKKALELGGNERVEEASRSSAAAGKTELCSRGHWRPAEDAKLKELVAKYGPQNWNMIAEHLQGRSGKSCRLRWFNQLDPKITKRAFSDEEEERLLAAHRVYGNKWALIAKLFPGRTDNSVKNHWHVIMARRQREQSSAYRRRSKPSTGIVISTSSPVSLHSTGFNNNMDESANSSTIDESAGSTCTDLSLTPFPAMAPPQLHHFNGLHMGNSSGERIVASTKGEGFEVFSSVPENGHFMRGPMTMAMGTAGDYYRSGQSDLSSNSEVSAAESVTTTTTTTTNNPNISPSGNHEDGNDKSNVVFIDFLGVGAP